MSKSIAAAPLNDVTIVGGGIAGAALATVLARDGFDVAVVEPIHPMPARFRAEKIEPDQADLLRRLGLLGALLPSAARVRRIDEAIGGRIVRSLDIEQYGIFYQDIVNGLRETMPPSVSLFRSPVVDSGLDGYQRWVRLEDGSDLRSRLVVVACGIGRRGQRIFGLNRRSLSQAHSVAFGFSLTQETPKRHPSESLTHFGGGCECGIDAITLFPMPDTLRANLFAYWAPKDPRVAAMAADPLGEIARHLPGFPALSGALSLDGKVERFAIELDRAIGYRQPGMVVIGDAFQSVCPATGTGLSKVLTDVERLAVHMPAWFASPGMASEKIESFYRDPIKMACDQGSLDMALRMRRMATDTGLRWRLRRGARLIKKTLQGLTPAMPPYLSGKAPLSAGAGD